MSRCGGGPQSQTITKPSLGVPPVNSSESTKEGTFTASLKMQVSLPTLGCITETDA